LHLPFERIQGYEQKKMGMSPLIKNDGLESEQKKRKVLNTANEKKDQIVPILKKSNGSSLKTFYI